MKVKDIVTKNPDCILYFGDNKDFFLSALEDVGTLKRNIVAISHNAERELKARKSPEQYVIVVKNGKKSGWNVINSVEFFKIDFANKVAHYAPYGTTKVLDWPVVDLSGRKGRVV